jgi:hypothetical protein
MTYFHEEKQHNVFLNSGPNIISFKDEVRSGDVLCESLSRWAPTAFVKALRNVMQACFITQS